MTFFSSRVADLARLLCVSALMVAGFSGAALAQSASQIPQPPVNRLVDANGVDLISGSFNVARQDLSIGVAGQSGLARVRGEIYAPDNLDSWLVIGGGTATGTITVTVGSSSETFSYNGSTHVATTNQGSASTLTYNTSADQFTYVTGDGTVYYYSNTPNLIYNSIKTTQGVYALTLMSRPSGEQVNYYYKTYQPNISGAVRTYTVLKSVVSNLGFHLKLEYAFNSTSQVDFLSKITAINSSIDYCDPNADSCTALSQTWPSVTLSPSTTGETEADLLGRTTTYTGQTSVTTPASVKGTVVYNQNAQVTSFTNGTGTWTYSYTSISNGTLGVNATDPLGRTRQVISNPTLSVVLSDADALGRTTTYTYDSYGRTTRVTHAEGDYISYTYDARGNVTQVVTTPKSGSGLATTTVSANYDATCTLPVKCNKPNSVIDARGNETDYTYDPTHGGVLTVTSPAASNGVRPQTRFSYTQLPSYAKNSSGALVQVGSIWRLTSTSTCQTQAGSACVGSSDEVKTTLAYNSANLWPTSTTQAAGDGSVSATTSIGYDSWGDVISTTDAVGNTTAYVYDLDRELVGVIGPDPDGSGPLLNRAVRYSYNADGLATLVEQGTVNGQSSSAWSNFSSLQQKAIAYDSLDRQSQVSVTASGSTFSLAQFSYDNANQVICQVQRLNLSSPPSSACTLGSAAADGSLDRITLNTYDAAGELTKVTTGYRTTTQRDAITKTFGQNGELLTVQDANANLTAYVYDGLNRVSQIQYPSATAGAGTANTSDYEGFSYDAASNVTGRRRRDGQSVTLTYDNLNRPVTDLLGAYYVYDNLSRLTSVSLNGQSVSGGYDALGRQVTETGALGTVRYAYDAAGRRTQLTYPDGFYVTYGYDAASELTTIKDNTGFTLATYAWDNYGRRSSLTLGNGATTSYTYDNYSNLALLNVNLPSGQNQAISLGYNPAGQIKSRSASNDAYAYTGAAASSNAYTLNGRNQIAVSGPSTFSYDGRGNLTNDGVNTYAYDIANRLTTVGSVSLSYDPLSRLAKTAGSATTQFAYDGSEIIAEYNSAGAEQSRYVRGPGNDQPIVWYNVAGGARYWLQANPQGSIIAVTGDNGAAAAINTYDDYGLPGSGNLGRFQYTGQAWIPEIRMFDYKSRIYSPNLGRFLQSDPIGYSDGLNFYNAMHSDPVNGRDPMGLEDWDPTCDNGTDPDNNGVCSDKSNPSCSGNYEYNEESGACDPIITVTAKRKPWYLSVDLVSWSLNNLSCQNAISALNQGFRSALPQGAKVPDGYYYAQGNYFFIVGVGGGYLNVGGLHVMGGQVVGAYQGQMISAGAGVLGSFGASVNYATTNPVGDGNSVSLGAGVASGTWNFNGVPWDFSLGAGPGPSATKIGGAYQFTKIISSQGCGIQ